MRITVATLRRISILSNSQTRPFVLLVKVQSQNISVSATSTISQNPKTQTMAPIPLLLCGQFPAHRATVVEAVKPDFEIIHQSSSTEDAIAYLSTRPMPVRAVIMGAGFSPTEFAAVRSTPGATDVPWLRPAHTNPDGKTAPPPGGPPSPEAVAKRCTKELEGKVELFREDGTVEGWREGEVWYF
jgi:hypothetical protein